MILYFSGTGNSEYVAHRIANALCDQELNFFEKIKDHDYTELKSQSPWIIVAPTYAWQIPHILEEWLIHTKLSGNKDIYFVMTCGDGIGNAEKYLIHLCSTIGMNDRGCYEVVMPENYIAMFKTPTRQEAISMIEKAEPIIDQAIECLRAHKDFPKCQLSIVERLSSGLVNHLFYPLFVHDKKFYVTDACISCGLCEKVCPLQNIKFVNGKPIWNHNCTHCMACISRCPKEAIEYGKHSHGLPRYTCPKSSKS